MLGAYRITIDVIEKIPVKTSQCDNICSNLIATNIKQDAVARNENRTPNFKKYQVAHPGQLVDQNEECRDGKTKRLLLTQRHR
jgi:glutathione peroxidase-family protein